MSVDSDILAERGVWQSDFEKVHERNAQVVGMVTLLKRAIAEHDDGSGELEFAIDGIRQMLLNNEGLVCDIEAALLKRGEILSDDDGKRQQQERLDAERARAAEVGTSAVEMRRQSRTAAVRR